MLRGSSNAATRPWRKARMRRAAEGSSWSRSRTAARSSSTFQAIALHQVLEGDRLGLAGAMCQEPLLGEVEILEVFDVGDDGLAGIKSLGSAGRLGQNLQARLDVGGQSNGKHFILTVGS